MMTPEKLDALLAAARERLVICRQINDHVLADCQVISDLAAALRSVAGELRRWEWVKENAISVSNTGGIDGTPLGARIAFYGKHACDPHAVDWIGDAIDSAMSSPTVALRSTASAAEGR